MKKEILIAVLVSVFTTSIVNYLVLGTRNQDSLMADYYATETSIHVSPHHLRKAMEKGDDSYILVDVRSQVEYEREHIKGAINIPSYKDPDISAYGDVERIVGEFSKLPKDKDIIVYCYSIPCMSGRKIGNLLAKHGIYVKQLGIGWNEWRYYWNLWNHEHEWNQTNVMDYIEKGEYDGEPVNETCQGEFDC